MAAIRDADEVAFLAEQGWLSAEVGELSVTHRPPPDSGEEAETHARSEAAECLACVELGVLAEEP